MNDMVCGEVTIDYTDESINPDMVVKRSDGTFVFHFVNVVDDIEMKMTHVIRGEDHLMNTKRDDGAAVGEYAGVGYLSEAVDNFIALLGWSPKGEQEIFSVAELIEKFDLDSVNRAPAKFDIDKCAWVNQQHLLGMEAKDFAEAAKPYVEAAGLKQAAELLQKLAEAFTSLSDWSEAKATIGATAKENGAKPGQLMFPTRVALSGMTGGPDLGVILELLGQDESIRRLNRAVAEIS